MVASIFQDTCYRRKKMTCPECWGMKKNLRRRKKKQQNGQEHHLVQRNKRKRRENRTQEVQRQKKKKLAVEVEEGDSDSDQDDEFDLSEGMEDEDVEDEEDDEDDEMNDKEEDESDDEEETVVSTKEKQKKQKQEKNKTPNKQNVNTPKKTPVTNGVTPKEQKSNKKTPGGVEKSPNANTTPKQKQLLDHGVIVKEIRVGNGAPAKVGKTVSVYYVGKLKDGNKVFDKSMKGDGFKFKLGKGEVIKGWDIGVQGMKVGGKRVIHCPPEAAYGAKGVSPKIPPNSTLIFEVELKNVH
uniref:peptidylprolyl isomerase n=1 Tax=Homalodisca liturata TaxID=320908 RepID=A0A1B6IKE2_9HEMI